MPKRHSKTSIGWSVSSAAKALHIQRRYTF
jgi:hypothetical protein